MSTDVASIVNATVAGLGFELVDFERAGGGMMRVYIDHPGGISVENCADVSNQLTRVLMVENIDYSRLEVSSPGLDRPLKTMADFSRFMGLAVKVRLNTTVDARKRFDGVVESVLGEAITFMLLADGVLPGKAKTLKRDSGKAKVAEQPGEEKRITVMLGDIERARLIPDI
jgi:ribosome maturation factor RimP